MGVASLVLGIISVIVGFIPLCGTWALVPAIVGLILGIVEAVKKSKAKEPKGKAIAGIVCSAIAIVIIFVWTAIIGATIGGAAKELNQWAEEFNSVDWNSIDWNSVD